MLFALELGERVVGVTSYCDYPPEAQSKEKVGDTMNPNLERIIALKPDLVIISTATQLEQFFHRLDELRIPVYVVSSKSVAGVLVSLKHLGEVTGQIERAEQLVSELQARLDRIHQLTNTLSHPRVLMVIQRDPLIVAGRETFVNDLIERAGGQSITADAEREWSLYSLETVVAKAPEVIILPTNGIKTEQLTNIEWPELADTPAIRRKRTYTINNDVLMRPGPRLVDGLEELARVLHPEVFIGSKEVGFRPEGPQGNSHIREGVGQNDPAHPKRPEGPTGSLIVSHLRRSRRGLIRLPVPRPDGRGYYLSHLRCSMLTD
jgi:iron complex transport system substrate-binding protein